MKYIMYVRKSTEDHEDRQVLSIDSQIEETQRKFPEESNGALIIKESKSAYKPYNRPEFQRMVELLESGKYQGVLAWHPDRLSREPLSGGMIMHLLDRGVIKELKFASYTFNNSPEGKMMLGLSLSQSKYSSEKLSVDVKRGMLKKCKIGSMPTKPPLGYMPDKMADKGEKRHIPDPERFDLTRKMWDLMLTGQYSVLGIVSATRGWGLTTRPTKRTPANPLSKSTVYKTFSNIYYAGKFEWNGEIYDGNHPPMITMEEYERVQELIGRKHVPRPKLYESLTSGLVRCPCGGAIVVGHRKKILTTGKNAVYYYARCSRQKKGQDCHEPSIKLSDLESQAVDYLNRIKISDAFHKWAVKNLYQLKNEGQKEQTIQIENYRKSHDACQKKLENLLNLKISPENSDGSLLSDDEFRARRSEIIKEREVLSNLLQQADHSVDKWADAITEAFDVAYNAQKRFEEGDIKTKKSILFKIGANLILADRKLRIEAKRQYIVFEEKLPQVRQIEDRGKLEISRYGQMKTATREHLFSLWSG